MTPFDLIPVADVQEHYGHKPGKTEVQQVGSSQCIHENGPYSQNSIGSHEQLIIF